MLVKRLILLFCVQWAMGWEHEKYLLHANRTQFDLEYLPPTRPSLLNTDKDELHVARVQGMTIVSTRLDSKRVYHCVLPSVDVAIETPSTIDPKSEVNPDSTLAARKEMLLSTIEELSGECFSRNFGWWTYRFCVGESVIQAHAENGVVMAQYSLGSAGDAPPKVIDDGGDSLSIELSYSGGSECDLTLQRRSTRVIMGCTMGSGRGAILAVREPASCHYVLHVGSELLCPNDEDDAAAQRDGLPIIRCVPELNVTDFEDVAMWIEVMVRDFGDVEGAVELKEYVDPEKLEDPALWQEVMLELDALVRGESITGREAVVVEEESDEYAEDDEDFVTDEDLVVEVY